MKPCKTCMSLRYKFVKWLAKAIGIMEDAPQKKETRMEWSTDQVKLLMGELTMNNYAVARENEQLKKILSNPDALKARIEELAKEIGNVEQLHQVRP